MKIFILYYYKKEKLWKFSNCVSVSTETTGFTYFVYLLDCLLIFAPFILEKKNKQTRTFLIKVYFSFFQPHGGTVQLNIGSQVSALRLRASM